MALSLTRSLSSAFSPISRQLPRQPWQSFKAIWTARHRAGPDRAARVLQRDELMYGDTMLERRASEGKS